MPLVFFDGSVIFSFGGQVSELLKWNYNIEFLFEEKFVSFEVFYDSSHMDTVSFVRNVPHPTPPGVTYHLCLVPLVILSRTQLKELLLLEQLVTNPLPHTPS